MSDEVTTRPRVFIEESFPTELLNQQVLRETGSTPFNAVHRWWSRKPLSFSRASVLASILPAGTTSEDFIRLLGMPRVPHRDFRLYQQTPSPGVIEEVHALCCRIWGDTFNVLDAFAGGGSIPFEAVRYSIPTIASDLNPVAVATMKAAIAVPAAFGLDFAADLEYWVSWIGQQLTDKLGGWFTAPVGERTRDYLWAHTAPCPECGLCVPLSATWWVDNSPGAHKAGRACAAVLIVPSAGEGNTCTFDMVRGSVKNGAIDGYDPASNGTISRGSGRCPRCRTVLAQNYLYEKGQAYSLGFQMYALAYTDTRGKLGFRAPTVQDIEVATAAFAAFARDEQRLLAQGLIPEELVNELASKSNNIAMVGLTQWHHLYTPRQLLTLTTIVEAIREAIQTYSASTSCERTTALALWLSMVLDRCVDMNSRLSNWDSTVITTRRATATHALNLMWNFPEPNGATRLWQWCAETVTGDYEKLCRLIQIPTDSMVEKKRSAAVTITAADAANLYFVTDRSISVIVTDPPYYESISYGELSDMFYVWQKRILGHVLPDLCIDDVTNKDVETIANPGRFRGIPNAADLADKDYETKLAHAFAEYYRVLRDDGVLTVQFNHKESGAWDILSQTLINAGFEITATWAVNTENPNSIHQAERNAVNSTVLLVCRKRIGSTSAWWEEVQPQVRQAVMKRVPELERMGMKGIDLYLASFGPALQVLSRNWPVRDRSNIAVRPEAALAEARQAVVDERMAQMTEGRFVQLDSISRYYLVAWDCFLTREFAFDEARLLALSTGDVDITALRDRYRIMVKRGSNVAFLLPRERVRVGAVNVRANTYAVMVDALHAVLALYADDGIVAAQRFFERTGLFANPDFIQFIELALKMLPPATEEHKQLTDLLLSDVKLRGAIQMPLFEDIEAQTHEQPRLF